MRGFMAEAQPRNSSGFSIFTYSIAAVALMFSVIVRAAEPEVRGTWLTTTADTAIATPQDTTNTMRRLRDVGLNTVYVECWKDGYTEFPSDVMRKTIGV